MLSHITVEKVVERRGDFWTDARLLAVDLEGLDVFFRCGQKGIERTIVPGQYPGGGTADEMDNKIEWFLNNLDRYRNDQPLRAVVDFDKGY